LDEVVDQIDEEEDRREVVGLMYKLDDEPLLEAEELDEAAEEAVVDQMSLDEEP
jgi:hypothetical protein